MALYHDLLGPAPVRLEVDPEPEGLLCDGVDAYQVAADYPDSSLVWAYLAEAALAEKLWVNAYAFARVGYHRGIDQLRKSGWKGFGPVPYTHSGNRGFLRSLAALAKASEAIGEESEHLRCLELVHECDPSKAAAESLGIA